MNAVTAQDLKTKGASLLKKVTRGGKEAYITVRGKASYVVLTLDQYQFLRECELESALKEAQNDLFQGNYRVQSVEEHLKDLKDA